ncbi:hypothetical protein Agub_g1573, partial [Astrephomene gubernaculifera]
MVRGGGKEPPYQRWLNNYEIASSWIAKHDVERAVEANGGLVRIKNFLPEHVAEGILKTLEGVPDENWNDTSATTDYRQNNISHSFSSVKHAKGLQSIVRFFSLVRPGALHAFSAAKYVKSDHIAPHDDRAYTQVQLDTGRIITTSRSLAVIYYLTRDWREEYGGVLVDLEAPAAPPRVGARYVPMWNSVVAFRVPRYHAVTEMTTERPRYSIFGWFLEPGKLYPLYRGDEDSQGGGQQQQQLKEQQQLREQQQQRKRKALPQPQEPQSAAPTAPSDSQGGPQPPAAAQQREHPRQQRQPGGAASGGGRQAPSAVGAE